MAQNEGNFQQQSRRFRLQSRVSGWVLAERGRSGHFLALAVVVAKQIVHVDHDDQIAQKKHDAKHSDAPGKFANFEWEKHRPGDKSDPLSPGTLPPQAISLDQAQSAVGKGNAGGGPEAFVGGAVSEVQKKLGVAAVGTDVKLSQQALRKQPRVLVNQQQGAQTNRHYENALAELEHRNKAQQRFLGTDRKTRHPGERLASGRAQIG